MSDVCAIVCSLKTIVIYIYMVIYRLHIKMTSFQMGFGIRTSELKTEGTSQAMVFIWEYC